MPLPIDVDPAAIEEAAHARDWYAARSSNAADSFVFEIGKAFTAIAEGPERFQLSCKERNDACCASFRISLYFASKMGGSKSSPSRMAPVVRGFGRAD
jgi:hypothetical protein